MRGMAAVSVVVWLGCGKVSPDTDGGTGSDAAAEQDAASNDGSPGDDGPVDAGIVATTCAAPPLCASAGTVATKEDIAAVGQNCATWGEAEIDSLRPRTPTLLVSQATSICPGDFALPDDCQGKVGCYAAIVVTVDPELAGVDTTAACGGVQLAAGSRFRMRFNLDPLSAGLDFLTAHVHFERPCGADCVTGEHFCAANDNCYADSEICFACGYGFREECACRDADNGILADCFDCSYDDPERNLGLCLRGVCELDVPCSTCPCPP
jgi:hypothetical protein